MQNKSVEQGNARKSYRKLTKNGDNSLSILISGSRLADGRYTYIDGIGYYWSASSYDNSNGWFFDFNKIEGKAY